MELATRARKTGEAKPERGVNRFHPASLKPNSGSKNGGYKKRGATDRRERELDDEKRAGQAQSDG
jgi:hypothetical protein